MVGTDDGARARPGRDGRFELDRREVVDPGDDRSPGGQRWDAPVNIRESALGHMAARGRIDPTELLAGERFRRLWERAQIGPARSLDPERFGGGDGARDHLTEELLIAGEHLAKALQALGPVGSQLLTLVVVEGQKIEDVARAWSRQGGVVSGRRAEGYVTGRIIEALDELVRHWGLEGKGRTRKRKAAYLFNGQPVVIEPDNIRAEKMEVSGPSHEITIDTFGEPVREEKVPTVDRGPLLPHSAGSAQPSAKRRKR